MLKKNIIILLIISLLNIFITPVFATKENENIIVKAAFQTELNVNKASKGQVVQFVSTEDYYVTDNFIIPSGTIFNGKIKKFKKGRWAYRRAKAVIKIDSMTFPNGEHYNINASTKRHVLKGSAIGNISKGIITLPVAIVVGTAGACVIIVETISIAGLIIVGPTSYLFGETMGKLTHGINYKKHQGDKIKLKIKNISNLGSELNL